MKKLFLVTLAMMFSMVAEAKVKTYRVTLTKDNSVTLNKVVNSQSTTEVVQKVKELDSRLKSKDPIFLVLDTPGGSISAGLEMIENLRNMNRPIHTITLNAFSMGFESVQGLGHRLVPRDGTLMAHKAWGVFYGEFPGQIDSRYSWSLRRVQRLAQRTVARTKGKHDLKSFLALIENEYWCDGMDCINQGFADAIVRPMCDKSLAGTHMSVFDRWLQPSMFGMIVVEIKLKRSDCPLSTGYLAWDIYVNGRPMFGAMEEKKKEAPEQEDDSWFDRGSDRPTQQIDTVTLMKIKADALSRLNATKNKKAIVLP